MAKAGYEPIGEVTRAADGDRSTSHHGKLRLLWCLGGVALAGLVLWVGWKGTASVPSSKITMMSLVESENLSTPPPVVQEDYSDETPSQRLERCRSFNWQKACQQLSGTAGARRRRLSDSDYPIDLPTFDDDRYEADYEEFFTDMEKDMLLDEDDPSVTYDEHCLRVYRLDLGPGVTFPYHANHLVRAGGNQTMALFIQHGAMRDADHYFCSFRALMRKQYFRPFDDILVIAPDFNYGNDPGVMPSDAFWNSSKPWGDWRVGAESDPNCCSHPLGGATLSSFDVLDHMLNILTDPAIYPNMNKISYIGHSAGGQMVQRYAITSHLAAKNDKENDLVDIEFIVANPSSYTYLDERRWKYNCGECICTQDNCTCNGDCTIPTELEIPVEGSPSWVCHDQFYDRWPYGVGQFKDKKHLVPYALRADPPLSAELYKHRHVIYMVGQNDTCNDNLPTCSADCWKKDDYLPDEWPCFRNHMDTRCPAMLEGPYRRMRGLLYMKYLRDLYGGDTHRLHVISGVGHNATAMFGSALAIKEIFD